MIVKLNIDEINYVTGGNTGITRGIIAGLSFGLLDIAAMVPLEMQNKATAMAGAFAGRFAIGFLVPNTQLPVKPWLSGAAVGLLLSLPDAIITGVYAPILGIGIFGGMVIGAVNNHF